MPVEPLTPLAATDCSEPNVDVLPPPPLIACEPEI